MIYAQDFKIKNAQDAFDADQNKSRIKAGDACTGGTVCAGNSVGQCVNGKIVTTQCAGGLSCQILPLVNKPGTSVACATDAEKLARLKANGLDVETTQKSVSGDNITLGNQVISGGSPDSQPLQQFKANDNECIDDTRFRKYTSATDFVIQSCPPGMCFTRSPPVKNPCVGKDNAIRIDGPNGDNLIEDSTATTSLSSESTNQFKANEMECIDDTRFKLFTSPTTFTIQSCPPGFCFTRNPPFKNPCVGKDNAIRIDNANRLKRLIRK